MEINDKNVDLGNSFPQHLCKMCGKCCSAITTPFTHEELLKAAKEDAQDEANVFIEIFRRYDSIDDARKAVPDHVENILSELKRNPDFDESKVSFYYCPHLTGQNKCAIHPTRPDCCRRAPRNGWSLFPPDCGFKGWQFQQREAVKATIRHLKETYMDLELMPETQVMPSSKKTVKELKDTINEKIKIWERYGAMHW